MTEPQAVLHLRRSAAAGGQTDLQAGQRQRPSPLGVLRGGGHKERKSVEEVCTQPSSGGIVRVLVQVLVRVLAALRQYAAMPVRYFCAETQVSLVWFRTKSQQKELIQFSTKQSS